MHRGSQGRQTLVAIGHASSAEALPRAAWPAQVWIGCPAPGRCGIGFWGGQCLSLADYVAGTGPRSGAIAAGAC